METSLLVLCFRMNYQEFLDYIFQRYSGNVKLELDRMVGLMEDMGNPQSMLHGIHIGGTNGKGSACATCEALALAHGFTTGLNTSPHLIDYCERFRINGVNIEFQTVLELFHRYEAMFTKWDASFFEITTAIAFQLFAERKIDLSIMEVGLGGRLDATNLFLPEVSAITTIGLDHVKTLGDTKEKIAFEKAGIIKQGVPVVLGRIEESPLQVILEQAEAKQAPVYLIDRAYTVSDVRNNAQGLSFSYSFESYHYPELETNLLGKHQAANISTALTAFHIYCQRTSVNPDESLIRKALKNIVWMGRMQCLRVNPIVIVDGAHNLQGVETLVANISEMFPDRRMLIIASILADKDYVQMLKALCAIAKTFYISKNESDRAAEIDTQTAVVEKMSYLYKSAPTVREAYQIALADAAKDDIILGVGSLYTVAEILSAQEKY